MRIIFMGTPQFAATTLRALHSAGHDIACVYCQPPRPSGRRGLGLVPSAVAQEATRLGIEVRSPLNFKLLQDLEAFQALNADVAVVVAYGLLLPQAILEGTRLGAYNGHASLLPRWRGAAPIQRAIMAGDSQTGLMIMKMDKGLDTGAIALSDIVSIDSNVTYGALYDRLSEMCATLMAEAMHRLNHSQLPLTPQLNDGVLYAKKIEKSETRIDWTKAAVHIHNHVRGLSPMPGSWCEMEINGLVERVKILRTEVVFEQSHDDTALVIACGKDWLKIVELQRAGSKPMMAHDFLRGALPTKVL
jgi:methionyl-tRNA formyltransferase